MYTQQEKQSLSRERAPGRLLNPRFFDVGVVIIACIGIALVLTVFEPPRLVDAYDVFATPEVLPEWYLLPAFAIIKSLPAKIIGLVGLGALVAGLFALPFLPDLSKRVPGGPWLGRAAFIAIHLSVVLLGFLTLR
ncbi:cytochrome b6/f complex subunit IV [Gloeobacter kilaueensis]|uniref:Cytochrome b6-f complex subunit 4 n=1 Tax=Gloeobacter kilaueensis (strain ATCC BAA-2537 / CCAP 1431/1 / ULC 316 / JS1) TaxID=1183438 RepID=U5QLZ6_GLOK1|nr:cytochrome b6/f complex subunit IV [Gloeobacter kilaueensis]AGY60007.1 cytochrome b6/f complex subunit IV [Gloeobacter kilaueensis JS1]